MHDAHHARCVPRGSFCRPMHPGAFGLACSHGSRRTLRCPRAQPRRCFSQPFPRKRPTSLHGEAHHDASQTEPGQHAQTPHEPHSPTPCTTPVHTASTALARCTMDTYAKAFRTTAPLADLYSEIPRSSPCPRPTITTTSSKMPAPPSPSVPI